MFIFDFNNYIFTKEIPICLQNNKAVIMSQIMIASLTKYLRKCSLIGNFDL